MRVQSGNYAYDLKRTPKGWQPAVFRIGVSTEELVESWCCSPTQDGAEREAQQIILLLRAQEQRAKERNVA
jgi:hypothetical protein